jgi:hypothetical protein
VVSPGGEVLGDSVGQLGGDRRVGVVAGRFQFDPEPGGGDIDGGVLPDLAAGLFVGAVAGFFEGSHVETVELDQITGPVGFEASRWVGSLGDDDLGVVGLAVAGQQLVAELAGVDPMFDHGPPHPGRRHLGSLPAQLISDPLGSQSRVGQREPDDLSFQHLVGPRGAADRAGAGIVDLVPPSVEGGMVDPQLAASQPSVGRVLYQTNNPLTVNNHGIMDTHQRCSSGSVTPLRMHR